MAQPKYADLIKEFSFRDNGIGDYRQGTEISADTLGFDVNIQYGTYWSAGKTSKDVGPLVCDYDQVSIWMGVDTYDIGYLGGEVTLCLGEKREKHVMTTATALAIPRGTPFWPAEINSIEYRFIHMNVSVTRDARVLPARMSGIPQEISVDSMNPKYKSLVQRLAFTRNGPYHYGPNNPDTHGGAITDINGNQFDFHMSYESMNQAPYRFSPFPDKPHVHPYTEFLIFMGADCNDLSELGAEIELYMGKEGEKYVITKPTVAIQPKGVAHLPLIVNRQEKPWIFAVLRPWGWGTEKEGIA